MGFELALVYVRPRPTDSRVSVLTNAQGGVNQLSVSLSTDRERTADEVVIDFDRTTRFDRHAAEVGRRPAADLDRADEDLVGT